MRARRLASIAVVAVVGVLALSGCRNEPGAAAYVDGHSYSKADVAAVLDEIKKDVPAEQQTAVRDQIVQMFVLRDAATRYVKGHNITVPATDPAAYAQQIGLPADVRFTKLAADYSSVLGAMRQSVQSVAPSEADQREAHSHITVQGRPVTESFETVRPFLDEKQLGKAVGFRDALRDAVNQAHVSVNPGYGDPTFQVQAQIGQAQTWLAVPLRTGGSPVVDLTAAP